MMSTKRKLEFDDIPMKKSKKRSGSVDESGSKQKVNMAKRLPHDIFRKYEQKPGKLLIAGAFTWETVRDPSNKSKKKMYGMVHPNLTKFHRFTDETYRFVTSGPSSAHVILITMDYKVKAMGENMSGQLGLEEARIVETPTLVSGMEGFNVISAATGRHHTLFLTDTGAVYACGENKSGQCGIGKVSGNITLPKLIDYSGPPIVKVGCGADFSVILDIKGNLYTFGLPEYGQLGHNTNGKFFITANKLSYNFETSPRLIKVFVKKDDGEHMKVIHEDVVITDFSCGPNHTVAIDSNNNVYSWGFGGYGRLGHAEQKDEYVPRLIKKFETLKCYPINRVFCGSTFTVAICDNPQQFYLFGKNKKSNENMYPKPIQDLCGWNITDMAGGNNSMIISTEDTLIAWGAAPAFGELGIGDKLKSTSVPKEVTDLAGMKIGQVTMGPHFSLLLVDTEDETTNEKYKTLQEYVIQDDATPKIDGKKSKKNLNSKK